MAMPARSMSGMAGMAGMAMAPPKAGLAYFGGAFVMWLLMMVAMMLPSATPMILTYARFARGVREQGKVLAPTALFAGVYLAVWAGFSLAAAGLQTVLVQSGAVSAASLALGEPRIAGALLIAAGLYQLTPLKRVCLENCRSPLSFLVRLWRPTWAGTVRLGLLHGLYCLGCCWLIMALLFVGGVMSLAWVAVLAVIVLIEKVAPGGRQIGTIAAGVAMFVGAALVLGLR
jgi:predicted metal-binding membrane protein